MWFMGQDGPTCGCVGCGNAPLPLFASLLLESSSPHPTPPSRKGKRLKEILRISAFAYHTYTCREMQQPFSWRALPGQPWELCRWLHTHAALEGTRTTIHPGVCLPHGVGRPRLHLSRGGAPCALAVLCPGSGLRGLSDVAPAQTCLSVSSPRPSSTGCSSSRPPPPGLCTCRSSLPARPLVAHTSRLQVCV